MHAYFPYFSKCKPYLNTVRDSNAGKKVFDLKLFCFANIFIFLKKGFLMKIADISIRDILSCEEFQIVLIRSYEIDSFIMGYHVYKADWTPFVGEKLTGVMESTDLMDKYAVAVKRSDESIVGHLPLGKSGKFAKTIFYFLKANEKHSCVINVLGKAINAGDGLGMTVPCRLLFFAEVKYINVLKEKLCTLL